MTTRRPFPRHLAQLLGLLLIFLLPAFPAGASILQEQPEQPAAEEPSDSQATDPDLGSPREAMFTFLAAINDYNDAPVPAAARTAMERAIKTLAVPPNLPFETKRNIARDLYTVLGRIGEVQPEHLPLRSADPRFVYYPQPSRAESHRAFAARYPGFSVVLTRDDEGNWRFSQSTIDQIRDFAIATEGEAIVAGAVLDMTLAERIRAEVPASLKGTTTLGLEHWQWIGILLVIFVGVVLDWLVRGVLKVVVRRFAARRDREVADSSLKRAVRPFGLIAAALLWYVFLELGLLPPTPTMILIVAVRVILVVSVAWGAFRLVDLLADWLATKAASSKTRFDDLLVPMVEKTAKIFIAVIGVIYIASAFNIEILPLLTGLGIGGLAVAFAAKDTIENFFGSVAVILDRPFEIGDWIVVDDIEGTVEDLGFRSTRVRTFYNSLVTVPNATLVRAQVDNYGRRKYRRFKTMVNVTYDTPPDKIESFCAGIREIIKLHPYTRKDYYHVWLNNFGAHSLDILVYVFFECPDWAIELREKHRLMLDIVRLADRMGVQFAFPTQTLHIFNEDQSQPHTPADIPDTAAERRAVIEGRKIARELTGEQPWKHAKPGPVDFAAELDSDWEPRGS